MKIQSMEDEINKLLPKTSLPFFTISLTYDILFLKKRDMKKILLGSFIVALVLAITPYFISIGKTKKLIAKTDYKNGDIIFQASTSRQCEAVKMATHSDISHCGLLFEDKGKWFVLEAVEPVQITPLASFIYRGTGHRYSIKRLKANQSLHEETKKQMISKGKKWVGKHYDIYFNWNDTELYCSELVWKLYRDVANIELCKLRPLRDYDLKDNLVGEMMHERYGNKIPYHENMVAPSDIYESSLLELVESR